MSASLVGSEMCIRDRSWERRGSHVGEKCVPAWLCTFRQTRGHADTTIRKHADTDEEARARACASRHTDRRADNRHRQTHIYVQAEAQNNDACAHRSTEAHADAQISAEMLTRTRRHMEIRKDTRRHAETHRNTRRHRRTETHRDTTTHTHRQSHTDTHNLTETHSETDIHRDTQ
eukprot:9019536-Alexandrium_andersonii.AAC.1